MRPTTAAVVTGAGGVLGREICLDIARRGAAVLAVDVDEAAAAATAGVVSDDGGTAAACRADCADEADVERYVGEALSHFGRIDWFANNAGIEGPAAGVQDYPADAFRRVLDVNVVAVFLGMKHVVPVMRRQGGGRIVNTASVAGLYATPLLIAYGASKHAVIGMTRTVAVETAAENIAVNAVCPGPQYSRMMESIEANVQPDDPSGMREAYTATVPMGRYGYPGEVAGTVGWLFDGAPPYLTGQNVVVDGGLLVA